MALAAQALHAKKARKPLEQGGSLEQVAARIERVMGLTPELSRAAKRRRLERIVRPLMRHRSEDPTVVHGKPRAEAVILQFPRTDMAHNLLGTNA